MSDDLALNGRRALVTGGTKSNVECPPFATCRTHAYAIAFNKGRAVSVTWPESRPLGASAQICAGWPTNNWNVHRTPGSTRLS